MSWPIVAQYRPSALTLRPTTGPTCDRKCFTNSIPSYLFFQNFKCPSSLPVMKKSVPGVTATHVMSSRCM